MNSWTGRGLEVWPCAAVEERKSSIIQAAQTTEGQERNIQTGQRAALSEGDARTPPHSSALKGARAVNL